MRIRSLTMKNFRGFEDATVDLDRPLTVLFGVNGSGKSSVLMGCALVLSNLLFVDCRPPEDDTEWCQLTFNDTDVRHGAREASVSVTLSNGDVTHEWTARRASHRTHDAAAIGVGPAQTLRARMDMRRGLAVFYEAARDVASAKDAFAAGTELPVYPRSAIHDALAVGHLKFRSLFQWFKEREDIENELKVSRQDLTFEDPQLSAVRRAITGALPGFSGLRIQRDPLHMVIRKGDQVLAIDQLSDGEKLFLALVADLARRLAMTYPNLADPLQGEAIVLIDEIELHLHPSWQRRALSVLTSTFPGCQIIVTTHSPQVLSEVPNDAVVLIQDFQFTRPGAPTAGRDSNAILAEAMDTPERPAVQLAAIRAIGALLDEGNHAEARVKIDALARDLSELDREVVGLRTMLHFLEGSDEAHPQGS